MPYFPLAADFRPGHGRHEEPEMRLIAALLGVSFDELKRREHAERVRTLRHAIAAAIALVIVFAALAAFAFAQRAQAPTIGRRRHSLSRRG